MARTECTMVASPERIWEVLADARYYGHWVVGSQKIRAQDANWPAVGSQFHHTVGVWPLRISDHTTVEAAAPPHVLRLRAHARPFGTFHITLQMRPEPDGETRVVMDEDPADRLTRLVFNPVMDRLVHHRNVVSLERLKELAEGRGPSAEESAAPS